MFSVCRVEFGVVTTRPVRRSVVVVGKLAPVAGFEILHEVGVFAELGKEFELLGFRFRHAVDEFVDRFAAAFFPVKSADLEHAPKGGGVGDVGVYGACVFESCRRMSGLRNAGFFAWRL